jgi:hypothetical protein
MPKNPIAAGLNRLYHYEKFMPEYLTDVLTNQRVHCSDPMKLNDPWDCRPWFSSALIEDRERLEKLIAWIFSTVPAPPDSEEQLSATKEQIRKDPEYRRRITEGLSRGFLELIPGRWKLYCLTPHADSTLMWSHYAENHRGICLEFSVDNDVFGTALEVRYLSSYPEWLPHSLAEGDPSDILLTKSDDWQYEHEYRVICFAEGVARPITKHSLFIKDGFLGLPAGSLKAVITGCEAKHEEIAGLVENLAPHVNVKRAVRAPDRYRLQIASPR